MKKISFRFVPTVSTFLLLGFGATALAAPPGPSREPQAVTRTVRFKDLDISTATGAQILYERIKSAARVVCRQETYWLVYECRMRAVDDGVKAVGSPLLASIHRSTMGRAEEVVVR
jgi:UrcA family protein